MVVYWTGLYNYACYMMLLSYKNMVEGQGRITVTTDRNKAKASRKVSFTYM